MRNSMTRNRWKKTSSLGGVPILVVLLAFLTGEARIAPRGAAQSNDPQAPPDRHDAWRFVPQEVPPEPTDPHEKDIFEARSRDSDKTNLYGGPLDQPQPDGIGHGEGFGNEARSEIPITLGEPIVIARFDSFVTYLTPSHRSIFTVVKLGIEQVLEPGKQGLSTGQQIDVVLSGGTIRLADGRVIAYRIDYDDAPYSLQPDHRYLFLLRGYDSDSNTCDYEKTWDLTTGVAVPNSLDDTIRVQQGTSTTTGLTEGRLINAVRDAITEREQRVSQPAPISGHIRGTVTDENGRPIPHMIVAWRPCVENHATECGDPRFGETTTDGHFDFVPLPPGDYVVSVNPFGPSPDRPYPRVYFPNAASDADAGIVHLTPFGNVDNIDVTLPNAWKPVVVHARVLLPDGSPAVSARIEAHDADYLSSGEPAAAYAGADGHADLTVYEGQIYYLTADTADGTGQICAGPLKFIAQDGLMLASITTEHKWGNCLAQLDPNFRPPD